MGKFLVVIFALHVDLIVNSYLTGLDILFKDKLKYWILVSLRNWR